MSALISRSSDDRPTDPDIDALIARVLRESLVDPAMLPDLDHTDPGTYASQAESVFAVIRGNLDAVLPDFISPRHDECLNALRELLAERLTPEQLVNRFIERVQRTPTQYFVLPEGAKYRSDTPSPSDQAMMSQSPRTERIDDLMRRLIE